MKTPDQTAQNRAIAGVRNVSGHQHNATERGREIAESCVWWVARWGYVSGPSLALFLLFRFGTNRPRIASELVRRGLLEAVDIPADKQEKLGGLLKIYRVSKATCRADKSLPPYRKTPPYWTSFGHTLKIQNFIATMINPDPLSANWLTERESATRARNRLGAKHLPTPDAVFKTGNKSEVWIEIETTSKRGKRRDLMATQFENLFRNEGGKGLLGGTVEGVLIVAPNKRVMQSYLHKSFYAEAIQPVERRKDSPTGYDTDESAWPIKPKDTFAGKVWLTYPDLDTEQYPGLGHGLKWHGQTGMQMPQEEPAVEPETPQRIEAEPELELEPEPEPEPELELEPESEPIEDWDEIDDLTPEQAEQELAKYGKFGVDMYAEEYERYITLKWTAKLLTADQVRAAIKEWEWYHEGRRTVSPETKAWSKNLKDERKRRFFGLIGS